MSAPAVADARSTTLINEPTTAPLRPGAIVESEMVDVDSSSSSDTTKATPAVVDDAANPTAVAVDGPWPSDNDDDADAEDRVLRLGPWSAEHDRVLTMLVQHNTFDLSWPTVRAILKRKVADNVEAFLASAALDARAAAASGTTTTTPAAGTSFSSRTAAEAVDGMAADVRSAPVGGPSERPAAAVAAPPLDELIGGGPPSAAAAAMIGGSSSPSETDRNTPTFASASAAAAEDDEEEEDATAEARVNPGWLIGGRTLPASITREEADVLERRIGRLLDSFER